jgi:hypothetical protein
MAMGIAPAEVGHLREFAALSGRAPSLDGIEVRGERIEEVARKCEWRLSSDDILRRAGLTSVALKCLPRGKAARLLLSGTIKNIGQKLGVYAEAFPAFGVCGPPEFDRRHF